MKKTSEDTVVVGRTMENNFQEIPDVVKIYTERTTKQKLIITH